MTNKLCNLWTIWFKISIKIPETVHKQKLKVFLNQARSKIKNRLKIAEIMSENKISKTGYRA